MTAKEPDSLQESARGVLLARAELEAFDNINAGVSFSSKNHDRSLLVEAFERARLRYLQASLHREGETSPGSNKEAAARPNAARSAGEVRCRSRCVGAAPAAAFQSERRQ
jgi:hypothetical protein